MKRILNGKIEVVMYLFRIFFKRLHLLILVVLEDRYSIRVEI